MKTKNKLILISIFIFSLTLRLFGLNWDSNFHLHPDERQIVMVTQNIAFPKIDPSSSLLNKIGVLSNTTSTLNPKFFAYGSFPIYFLKFTSFSLSFLIPEITSYDNITLLGRVISAVFDSLTVILIYKITFLLFKKRDISILAALIYSLSILPVQLSHFYAVDTLLNFFIFFTLYYTIRLYHKFNFKNAFLVGLGFGLSLATKISATVLIFSIGLSLFVSIFLSLKKELFGEEISSIDKIKKYFKKIISRKFWIHQRQHIFKDIILYSLFIMFITEIVFFIFEPFAVFDFSTFWIQINEQSAMTKNAFVFPYTLQYVNTLPYLYQLKNIFLWGLGPIFALLSIFGAIFTFKKLRKGLLVSGNERSEGSQLILFSFVLIYFLVVGKFAIKFNRYCLPLYPVLAIFAANFISTFKNKYLKYFILIFQFILLCAFLNIYTIPNTRVSATEWINQNIPSGNTVLREHWDDGLPLGYRNDLTLVELPLYDSDKDLQKWPKINNYLNKADYLIIASNRLYTPLQKLTDCQNLPPDKCYSITTTYYQDLFSGKLGYIKVAEFSSYPNLFGININDQSADESFTVYDHPKVLIFKNTHSKFIN